MRRTFVALLSLIAIVSIGIVVNYFYPSHPYLSVAFPAISIDAETAIAFVELITAFIFAGMLIVESLPFLGESRKGITTY